MTTLCMNQTLLNNTTSQANGGIVTYDRDQILAFQELHSPSLKEYMDKIMKDIIGSSATSTSQNRPMRKKLTSKAVKKEVVKYSNKENLNNDAVISTSKTINKLGEAAPKPMTPIRKQQAHTPSVPSKTDNVTDSSLALSSLEVEEFVPAEVPNTTDSQPSSPERRLEQREKQIRYGYNTEGYKNYIQQVPKSERKKGMPQTPNKYQDCSKRSWDGQIRVWRKALHMYDEES